MTLMDATADKDPLVQEQIFSALCSLGRAEPEEVLNACEEYLRQHEKVGHPSKKGGGGERCFCLDGQKGRLRRAGLEGSLLRSWRAMLLQLQRVGARCRLGLPRALPLISASFPSWPTHTGSSS